MRERVKWLDTAKAIGIFLIYLGHCGTYAGYARQFVFTHHVPFFFFLSGCAARLSPGESVCVTIRKTVKGILIPWLFFVTISLAVHTVKFNAPTWLVAENIKLIARGTVRNTFVAGLWFLTCIAVVRIGFATLLKILRNHAVIFLLCLGMHFAADFLLPMRPIHAPSWPYNTDSALYYMVYYATGYMVFPFVNRALNAANTKEKLGLLASTAISAVYAVCLFFGKDLLCSLPLDGYLRIIHNIAQPMLVIWLYLVVAKMLEEIECFQKIGRNTLYLCGSEYYADVILKAMLAMVGFGVTYQTPLCAYIYAVILLSVTMHVVVPWDKKCLQAIYSFPKWLKK